jgi:hypothetical protein
MADNDGTGRTLSFFEPEAVGSRVIFEDLEFAVTDAILSLDTLRHKQSDSSSQLRTRRLSSRSQMTVAASTQRPRRATVHSAPGAGTTVRIELPLVPPAIPGDED